MKKFIIRTNKWYDNLPELKRFLFFLIVIMGSLFVAQYLMYVEDFIWAFPIWALLVCFWRIGYVFIQWYENAKNNE